MSEKSTVNMNVKTSLLKQIRQQNPEMADLKATQIVNLILRAFIEGKKP